MPDGFLLLSPSPHLPPHPVWVLSHLRAPVGPPCPSLSSCLLFFLGCSSLTLEEVKTVIYSNRILQTKETCSSAASILGRRAVNARSLVPHKDPTGILHFSQNSPTLSTDESLRNGGSREKNRCQGTAAEPSHTASKQAREQRAVMWT